MVKDSTDRQFILMRVTPENICHNQIKLMHTPRRFANVLAMTCGEKRSTLYERTVDLTSTMRHLECYSGNSHLIN